jgi:hypothetical protein
MQHLQDARTNRCSTAAGASSLERLPTELLSQIVTIFVEESNDIITITQISRRLRQVVFGTSSIWRAISLLTTSYDDRPQYIYEDVRNLNP